LASRLSAALLAPIALALVDHILSVLLDVLAQRPALAHDLSEASARIAPDVAFMSTGVDQLSFSNRFASHSNLQL
jgi:hypothetical protein